MTSRSLKAGRPQAEGNRGWPAQGHRLIGLAIVLLAGLAAVLPQILQGNSCGHDFDFHLVSWLDAQRSWREGIPYPHWSPSPNFGAGEPRFVFYPPLSWMLGAFLGSVMRWGTVPIVITYVCLAGTGLATRALARQALHEGPATLAGCAALFSGYALFTAYERSDFGELMGGFWIPLLLLLILRDRAPNAPGWRRALDGSTVPLAVVIAGAWLSNAPLGVMTCYLLAGVALAIAVLRRTGAPLARASLAAALGLGLASLYIVPAALEQRWVEIRQSIDDPGYQVENSWLFARHSDPALELHDLELLKASGIATTMLALAVSGALISWARHRFGSNWRWWATLSLIPLAVLFLQFPISDPLWNLLPKLRFLQFPWRWLVVVEAPMGIFFAAAIWITHRRWRILVLAASSVAFAAATVFAGFSFFQYCDEEDAVAGMLSVYQSGVGFEGSDEYATTNADNSLVPMGLPEACLTGSAAAVLGQAAQGGDLEWRPDQHSCQATIPAASNPGKPAAEHLRLDTELTRGGFLILRLRSYPAWQIRVNGHLLQSLPSRADGLITVPVNAGPNRITADWTTTGDVLLGRWLSGIALLATLGVSVAERRLALPHL
jgi:6-pyruvoyl-tetrahydropterin synthase related domain